MSNQNVKKTAAKQPSSFRRWLPIGLAVTAGLCFLVVLVIGLLFYLNPFDTAESISRPLVLINAPADGDQVVIWDYTIIHAVARDEENIVRVEFWVDDTLKDVQTSSLEDGISPFPFLADWMPTELGRHTLAVELSTAWEPVPMARSQLR